MADNHDKRLVGLEESLSLRKPGDFIPLVKPKRGTKGSPTKRSQSALRLANPTSETTSLEMARLRRLSVPLTPTGISVVKEVKRFNELEDQLDLPVDQYTPKRKIKNKKDKTNVDDIIIHDDGINPNETAAIALLQIAKETAEQLKDQRNKR